MGKKEEVDRKRSGKTRLKSGKGWKASSSKVAENSTRWKEVVAKT